MATELAGYSAIAGSAGVWAVDAAVVASGTYGVFAESNANVAVLGQSAAASGIGVPPKGGVVGDSSSGAGVTGLSSVNNGVYGETTSDLINNSGVSVRTAALPAATA